MGIRHSLIFFAICIGQNLHAQDTTRLSLLFVGDLMQHDSQIASAYNKSKEVYDYEYCFQYVRQIISQADVAIGNLEVTLGGAPYKGYPQFSAPDELATSLKDIGFDVLVTANNHCVDRGKKGLERTIRMLDSIQLQHTGTFIDSASRTEAYPLIVNKNGFRLAVLNYTYGTNGLPISHPNIVNLIDTTLIKEDIQLARENSPDHIIVFFHWGNEYQSQPNKVQQKLTSQCFDWGVDLVIGSHPHVLQPIEWNKEASQLVVYSLGNFVSGQRTRYRDGGAMVHVELQKVVHDSLSSSTISDINYELVWVKVGASDKYTILPVMEFEDDTIHNLSISDQKKFKTFIDDSRALYNKFNANVSESDRPLVDSIYYRVWLATKADSVQSIDESQLLEFYGLYPEKKKDSVDWLIGKFYDRDVARQALADVMERSPYKEARVVKYWWGRRKDE